MRRPRPVDSALGLHPDPALDLGIPEVRRRHTPGVAHLDLLTREDVYTTLRDALASTA